MTSNLIQRIGLIAGSSEYPLLFAKEALKNNVALVIFAFSKITSPEIAKLVPENKIHWVKFGQLDELFSLLKLEQITYAVFVGKVPQTVIFKAHTFDARTIKLLAKLTNKQTDSLLSAVADEFAKEGITLLDATLFLKSGLADPGAMTSRQPTVAEFADIQFGYKIAKHIAAMDIGQSVIVKNQAVLAVEAIEGTDAAIDRAVQYGGEGIVIVKVGKPKQDIRFDVPIIGKQTIEKMVAVKAGVLGVESGATLILDKPAVIEHANKNNICIYGIKLDYTD
ncbi:MAG: UDP-2,3-diacylglucosamine diphosphatase LpxI [bacterium]|nr:UDP-2,3-diacylglucosamine diphosphatase LpxI [bacterium]